MNNLLYFLILLLAAVPLASAERYFYDSAGRLVRVEYDNGSKEEYSYDRNGNRVFHRKSGAASAHEPPAAGTSLRVIPAGQGAYRVRFSAAAGNVSFALIDILGRTIASRTERADGSAGVEFLWDLSGVAPGLYGVIMHADGSAAKTATVIR